MQTRKVKLLASRLFFSRQNTALCVAECIPHSFLNILMFCTVFTSLQSWGSKISTPLICWCKGSCLLRFPTKIAEHCLHFHSATVWVISQPGFLESSWIFRFPSILICFFLINTVCSSSVSFFSDSLWLRFGAKKLSNNVRTRFRCDM